MAKVKSIPEPSVMKFTVDIIVKYHHVIDNHYQVFDQEYLMKSQIEILNEDNCSLYTIL